MHSSTASKSDSLMSCNPLYRLVTEPTLLRLEIVGDWSIHGASFSVDPIDAAVLSTPNIQQLLLDFNPLKPSELKWDSTLPAFLHHVICLAQAKNLKITYNNFPQSLTQLLSLANQSAAKSGDSVLTPLYSFAYRLGLSSIDKISKLQQRLVFLGEILLALVRLMVGKKLFRAKDFWLIVQECGADALPIVTLISFLVGLTMAFVGAIQLSEFGASIYVANLVALAMVREMGAVMAGIIVCGRTGAAFASHLGSMKVSEEIDALKTMGLNPMEFLVLPRFLALFFMMPLLCFYANFVGILGGLTVGMTMLDLSFFQYILQTQSAVSLTSFSTGIIKSTVFGGLVALAGCYKGFNCGQNASAVGHAATAAVVSGITSIVVADAFFAVLFHLLDI